MIEFYLFNTFLVLLYFLLQNNMINKNKLLSNYFKCFYSSNIILKTIILIIKTIQNLIEIKILNNKTIWEA